MLKWYYDILTFIMTCFASLGSEYNFRIILKMLVVKKDRMIWFRKYTLNYIKNIIIIKKDTVMERLRTGVIFNDFGVKIIGFKKGNSFVLRAYSKGNLIETSIENPTLAERGTFIQRYL